MARKLPAPRTGIESVKGLFAGVGVFRPVDFLQFGGDSPAVFPRGEVHRVSNEMDDAGLRDGLRENRVDCLRKALQAVDDGDKHILDAAVFQLVHHPQPEFGAFRGFDPKAPNIIGSVRRDAQRDIDRLVAHQAFVTDYWRLLQGAAATLPLARNLRKGGEARKGPTHLSALDAAGKYADLCYTLYQRNRSPS